MRLALLALCFALAAPAAALDLPPPARSGGPILERFYLASDAAGDLALLAARIECVAFHRARIAGYLDAGLLAGGWTRDVDRLWQLSEALDAFEAAHIRPFVDPDTQAALADLVLASGAEEARSARCASFGDIYAFRRLAG